jgi:hypothetical protein
MRTLFLFLSFFFVASIAAQERNYESSQMGMAFRGKTLFFEAKKNPDGTWNDTYRDSEGNPLSELERHVIQGSEKLSKIMSNSVSQTEGLVGSESPSLLLVTGIAGFPGFGENPEFRDWSGITLEQVRNMRLAMWDMVDYPPDELVEIFVRAATTEDAEELETLGKEMFSFHRESVQKMEETLSAELSPEQIQKLWELEWHMPTGSAFIGSEEVSVHFGRYNAFDLSEEQKKRIEALKKEFLQADPELKKLSGQESNQKLIELVKGTREKLKGTLTDAQKAKLDKLLSEKPKFLTQPPPPPSEKEREVWVPGPDSWKPGDPLPPGVLPPPPPAGRFPRL